MNKLERLRKKIEQVGEAFVPEPDKLDYRQYDTKQEVFHLVWYEWVKAVIADCGQDLTVLDAACGTGYGSYMIAEMKNVKAVHGVEIRPEHHEYADLVYNHPKIGFHRADVADLLRVFPTHQCFDVVVSSQTIEHLVAPWDFIESIQVLLKRKGTLILTSPTRHVTTHFPQENPCHVNEFGPKEYMALLLSHFREVLHEECLPHREIISWAAQQLRLPVQVPPMAFVVCRQPFVSEDRTGYLEKKVAFLSALTASTAEQFQALAVKEYRSMSQLNTLEGKVEFLEGFYRPERWGCWSQEKGRVTVLNAIGSAGCQMKFRLPHPWLSAEKMLKVSFNIDGVEKFFKYDKAGTYRVRLDFPERKERQEIYLEVSETYCPKAEGASSDGRQLGLGIQEFVLF